MGTDCAMCTFVGRSQVELIKHTIQNHKYECRYQLKCLICPYTATSWNAFKIHTRRKHRQKWCELQSTLSYADNVQIEVRDGEVDLIGGANYLRKQALGLALRLETKYKVAQFGITEVMQCLHSMFKDCINLSVLQDRPNNQRLSSFGNELSEKINPFKNY